MANKNPYRKIKSSAGASGRFTITTLRAGTDEVLHTQTNSNIVLNQGLNLLPRRHIGESPNLEITTLELGTDDTAPTAGDTALGNATVTGVTRANQSATGQTAFLSFFLPDAIVPNGEYKELGVRTGGGVLYTRALIDPTFTKSANEDTRIDYEISYSAVV